MARELEVRFFECPECNRFTLLGRFTSADACPSCGSLNGLIISKVEKRLDVGTILNVDLSPGGRHRFKHR